ncbi:MAG: hypothetical protein ABIO70_31240 [Pseudomonadota bacterium]
MLASRPALPARIEGRLVPRPARIVLDLGRCWNGETVSARLPPRVWQEALLQAVAWLGPVPVTFLSRSARLPPDLPELLRFVTRLECPAALFGVDGGIDGDLALRLVDLGLRRACLVLGGVNPDLHAEVAGLPLEPTTGAVTALVRAREARRSGLDVVVAFPCTPSTASNLSGVEGWARQVGADGFAVSPPFNAPPAPAEVPADVLARVRSLERSRDRFHRTPPGTSDALCSTWAAGDGGPGGRAPFRCPAAGLRLDIRACGRFGACPFKRSIDRIGGGGDSAAAHPQRSRELPAAWAAGQEHFEAIRACERRCWHPELLPRGLRAPWEP